MRWNFELDIDIVAAWTSEWYANPFVIPSLDTWAVMHLNTTPASIPVISSKFQDPQGFFELYISREPPGCESISLAQIPRLNATNSSRPPFSKNSSSSEPFRTTCLCGNIASAKGSAIVDVRKTSPGITN